MALDILTKSFVPEIVNAEIMRTLENELVAMKVIRNYSNKVAKFGELITFPGLADPTISEYTGSIASYEDLEASEVNLLIDRRYMYNFKIKDIEAQIANVDFKSSQIARAAYGLQNETDAFIFGQTIVDQAGNSIPDDDTCDSTSIFSDLALMSQKLDENNVRPGDKWVVIPPWVKQKLILQGIKFQVNNGMDGKKGGIAFADYEDLTLYVSNNVWNSNTTAAPVSHILAGSTNAIAFAQNISESEVLRNQSGFDWLARGLHIYGAKVIKPMELVSAKLTYAAETNV